MQYTTVRCRGNMKRLNGQCSHRARGCLAIGYGMPRESPNTSTLTRPSRPSAQEPRRAMITPQRKAQNPTTHHALHKFGRRRRRGRRLIRPHRKTDLYHCVLAKRCRRHITCTSNQNTVRTHTRNDTRRDATGRRQDKLKTGNISSSRNKKQKRDQIS